MSDIYFIIGKLNSDMYTYILSDSLFPFAHYHYGEEYEFQQDNIPVHTSKDTKTYYKEEGIYFMEWPAKSPDMNPIQNWWEIMSWRVYKNGNKQYNTKDEPKEAICKAWHEILIEILQNLVNSMIKHCSLVILKNGNTINYKW